MNYPVSSSNGRVLLTFCLRFGIILLLIFFIAFFIIEALSFIRLFEVTKVANPAMNVIK